MKSIFVFFLAVLTGALIIAGCGGGGSTSNSGSEQNSAVVVLTKAELIKQGDEICAKTDQTQEVSLRVYLKKHPKAKAAGAEQEKMILAVGVPPIQVEAEELGRLGAPAGDAAKVGAIVKGIEQAVKLGEENPKSLTTREEGPFTAVDKLAREYGFKVCSQAL